MMTLRVQAASAGKLTMAWRSPTNRPYGPGRIFPTARTPCPVSPTKPSGHCPLSTSRGLLRGRQVGLGGAFREKVRILERLRRSSCRALPREDFLKGGFNKLLLDPARTGAQEVIEKMNFKSIDRIVYISCNPSTLARDAGILVNDKGFKLEQAGIMDMFPHTTHVESIAVFGRKRK